MPYETPSLSDLLPLSVGVSMPGVKRVLQAGAPFSAAELRAMSIDGLLTNIHASTYLRVGELLTPTLRAQAVSAGVPYSLRQKMTLGRLSAAWVYGCAPAPEVVSLLTDRRRRTTATRLQSGTVVHEVDLPASDVTEVAGIAITTPLRTACDLALYSHRDRAAPALAAMGANPSLSCPLADVRAELHGLGRVPRKLAALELLDRLINDGGDHRRP